MVDPLALGVGICMVSGGIWLIVRRQRTAAWLHERQNAVPDPKWRPEWMPWQFRPTLRQAMIESWLFALSVLAFGLYSLIAGIGVGLRY